jgi:hypothetical protein
VVLLKHKRQEKEVEQLLRPRQSYRFEVRRCLNEAGFPQGASLGSTPAHTSPLVQPPQIVVQHPVLLNFRPLAYVLPVLSRGVFSSTGYLPE